MHKKTMKLNQENHKHSLAWVSLGWPPRHG